MSEATPVTAPVPASTPAATEAPATPAPEAAKPPEPAKEPAPAASDWVAIRAQEERLRRERESLKSSAKEADEAKKFQAEIRRLAKENPEEAAKLAGLDYKSWTQQRLSGGTVKKDPVAEIRAELEKFKAETAAEKQKAQEQAYEAHWNHVTEQFSGLVKGSGDKHEFLRAEMEGNRELVLSTLREMAQSEQGQKLTLEQAADLYEQHLESQVKRYLSTAKLRKLIPPPATPVETKPSEETPRTESGTASEGNGARTLTNGHAQERSASPVSEPANMNPQRTRDRDEEDRIKRALALLKQ